jgi:hypothetical protein
MRLAGAVWTPGGDSRARVRFQTILVTTNQPSSRGPVSRRRFFQFTVGAVGLAVAGTLGWEIGRRGRAGRRDNPFSLDVSGFREIDPALLHFEPVQRFAVPRPNPRRLAIDAEDRLHVAAGRYVVTLDRDGNRLGELACAAPVRCVAVAEDGTRYVGFRDHVEIFDRRGQRVSVWDQVEGRPFLTGLALSPNELFIADSGNRLVWRHDRSGRVLGRIGERDPDRNIAGLILPSPCLDVVLAPDGLLRVNNPGRHRVEIYTVEGHLELYWGRASAAIDGFSGCCNPVAIDATADGRTITFEKGMPRVKIYTDTGVFESVVAGPNQFRDAVGEEPPSDPDEATIGGLDGAIDSSGRIHVLDRLAQDVQGFERSLVLSERNPVSIR